MSVVQMKPVTLAWAMREVLLMVLASRPKGDPLPRVAPEPTLGDAAVTLDAAWPVDWMKQPAEEIRTKYLLPLAQQVELGTRAWDRVSELPNPIGAFQSERVTRKEEGRGFSLRGMLRIVPMQEGNAVVQVRVDVVGQGPLERVHERRKLVWAYLEAMPEEAFGWFIAWGVQGWPSGLGGFSDEARGAIEAFQAECQHYRDLMEQDRRV